MGVSNFSMVLYYLEDFIYRCGSIKTCHVQKHGTEIFDVDVWHYFMTCFKKDRAKIISDMYKMDINVQYTF